MSYTQTADLSYIQSILNLNAPLPQTDCLLTSIDIESWTRDSHPLTEIGVSILDSRDVHTLTPDSKLSDFLAPIKHYHFRLRDACHLKNNAKYLQKNGKHAPGHYDKADMFGFGQSEFVTRDEIAAAMAKILRVPGPGAPGQFRNVVFISHAGDRDVANIQSASTAPLNMFAWFSRTIDLQGLSKTVVPSIQAAYGNNQPGLAFIMQTLQLSRQDSFVHNAGNDASFQLICAMKLALDEAQQRIPGLRVVENPEAALIAIMTASSAKAQTPVQGTFTHCSKCNSLEHLAKACSRSIQEKLYCTRCVSREHVAEMCPEHDDNGRLNKIKRQNYNKYKKGNKQTGGQGGSSSHGKGAPPAPFAPPKGDEDSEWPSL